MKKWLCICCFLCSISIYSQEKFSISGTVKDKTNGETVLGATIYIKGTTNGTVTNEYGFYSLTAAEGTQTLVVSFLGYKTITQEITLTADQTVNFEISEASTSLETVVIEAEESERVSIRKPQMSVAKLNAATIKQMPVVLGEVDVLKSIQLLPGVTNGGEGTAGFNVRGGAADQNLVLLDEAIIYNTSHFFGFFSVFNADAIKDIKLYKGDIPAKFGGRISSVLDVRQKDGNSKNFAATGGIGLISSRLALEGPLFNEKSSFLIAGRTSYAHLFMPLIEEIEDDKISFYDINLKSNYEINEKNRIYLSGYFGRDVFDLSQFIKNRYGNTSANLRWNHIFNEKLFSNLSLIYSEYDYEVILDFIKLDWDSDIKNFNLKYDFKYYLNEKIQLDFGISGIYYKFNPGEVKPSDETSTINYRQLDKKRAFEGAAYISAEHELTPKLTAQYGVRLSTFSRLGGQALNNYANNLPVVYNEQIGIYEEGTITGTTTYEKSDRIETFTNVEPRLGLSYQLNSSSSVKASYTRSVQYIHLLSNTSSVTPLDVWAPSGEFIQPQKSNQYAVGYYRNSNDKTYTFEAEAYFKNVDNRIDYIDGSDLIGTNTIETEILNGEARAYGLEFLFRKNKGDFTGWFAYTLSRSEQRTLGGNAGGPGIIAGNWYKTPFDRTHDISITGNYQLNEKWKFGVNFIYQTGRPVTYPNGQYQYDGLSIASFNLRNEDRLADYHRLDLSAIYTPSKNNNRRWQSEWVFGLYNAYARRNAASVSFVQDFDTGQNEARRISVFGSVIPSITYNFKF